MTGTGASILSISAGFHSLFQASEIGGERRKKVGKDMDKEERIRIGSVFG